jgi:hypothetical protein
VGVPPTEGGIAKAWYPSANACETLRFGAVAFFSCES